MPKPKPVDTPSKTKVKVRAATRKDIPKMVELNHAAYPLMAAENIVWAESHLLSHLETFPEGQLVATIRGKIIGAAASLIVDLGKNPLRHHTWAGITDSGYFSNHDWNGDTLYGADVYVHPEARGLGAGQALYEARPVACVVSTTCAAFWPEAVSGITSITPMKCLPRSMSKR